MFRPLLLLICILCLSAPLFAQENAAYPLCIEQPITSRERIVFTAYYEVGEDVYITDPENGDICLLLENTNALHFDWSPDGDEIVFGEIRTEGIAHLYLDPVYTIKTDGTQLQQISQLDAGANGVTWSPDGSLIAYAQFTESSHDAIVIQEGFQRNVLLRYDLQQETGAWLAGEPEWSPNGEWIALQIVIPTAEVEEHYDEPFPRDIGVLHLSSEYTPDSIDAIGTEADDFAPTWSPDGKYIAFTSEIGDMRQLRIADFETGETRESSLEIASYVNNWLADGRLAFTAQENDDVYGLYVTDASMTGDWTTIERVPLPFNIVQFDWWIDPATIEVPETP